MKKQTNVVAKAPEAVLQQTALTWPEKARALAVSDQGSYDLAADALRGIKALKSKADETFDKIILKARESLETARAEKNKIVRPLDEAEEILKTSRLAWQREQERLRCEEQDRLDRAAQEEAEAERQREIAAAKARGASRGEVKAIARQPVSVIPVEAPPTVLKSEGLSQRPNWKGEVTSIEALLIYIVLGETSDVELVNPQFLGLLEPNGPAVNALARALKTATKVPGVRVWNQLVENVRL